MRLEALYQLDHADYGKNQQDDCSEDSLRSQHLQSEDQELVKWEANPCNNNGFFVWFLHHAVCLLPERTDNNGVILADTRRVQLLAVSSSVADVAVRLASLFRRHQ